MTADEALALAADFEIDPGYNTSTAEEIIETLAAEVRRLRAEDAARWERMRHMMNSGLWRR